MTRDAAFIAMLEGKKVKHRNYSDDEFIRWDGTQIRDENDYKMGDQYGEFWSVYQRWVNDWEVVKES